MYYGESSVNNAFAYWCISGFLFLWGVAYLGLVIFSFFISTPDHWAALVSEGRIKAEYAVYISEIPRWVVGATLLAALTRFGGGVALLLKHGSAFALYALSFVLVAVIMFRGFFLADVTSVIRRSQVFLEIAFLLISAFAIWYAYLVTIDSTPN